MAVDVAALNLKVDSSSVVKATADLEKFTAAANRAGASAGKPTSGTGKLAQDYARAADMANRYSNSASRAASAAQSVANATRATTPAIERQVGFVQRLANAYDMGRDAINHWLGMIRRVPAAADSASVAVGRVSKAVNDNARNMQATPANIAAQFQDIGVTAAMGMNPMMIALQQGTQLSAAFAGGGLKNLLSAITSIISPVSILTIGIVALVAAGLQMVDWAKLANSALNGLATALEVAAPYAASLAAVLALAFAPQIISAIVAGAVAIGTTLYAAIVKVAAAMVAFAVANPFTAIVLGAAAATAAFVYVGNAFGQDFVTPIKNGINFLVGGFVGAFDAIQKTWRTLPAAIGDAAIQATNAVIRTVDAMVNGVLDGINGLIKRLPFGIGDGLAISWRANSGQIGNPYAGTQAAVGAIAKDSIKAAQGVDYVGKAIAGVNALASSGAAKLREWAKALSSSGGDGAGKSSGSSSVGGAAAQDKWAELLANATKQQRALDQAGAQIGTYGQALATLRREQELFNQAQDQGITLTAAMAEELRARARAMGETEYNNTRAQAAENSKMAHEEAMRQLEVERGAIALSGEALTAYQYLHQAINRELSAGVAMKDIDIAKLEQQSAAYARFAIENDEARKTIERMRKSIDEAKSLGKSFFMDVVNGAREGKSAFTAFADAVVNALNRVIDKLLDRTLDTFLDALLSGGINSLFGGLFGGGLGGGFGSAVPSSWGTLDYAPADYSSLGNVSVPRFAKGGAFTNQVVSTPTLFRFAKGTQIGEMGEAGPEAIMPLKRGPDGSLGVQVTGGGRPSVRMGDVYQAFNLEGAMTPEVVFSIAQQSSQASEAQIRKNFANIAAEYENNGVVLPW